MYELYDGRGREERIGKYRTRRGQQWQDTPPPERNGVWLCMLTFFFSMAFEIFLILCVCVYIFTSG
jgi:hypothetical protein